MRIYFSPRNLNPVIIRRMPRMNSISFCWTVTLFAWIAAMLATIIYISTVIISLLVAFLLNGNIGKDRNENRKGKSYVSTLNIRRGLEFVGIVSSLLWGWLGRFVQTSCLVNIFADSLLKSSFGIRDWEVCNWRIFWFGHIREMWLRVCSRLHSR